MKIIKNMSIVAMLGHTSHKMRLLLDREFHKANSKVNVEKFVLLNILRANEGVNQQQLAKMIDKDKTTIARLVGKMEKSNLLLRISSKHDKRSNHIYITNYGKEVLLELSPIIKQVQEVFVQKTSNEELEVFYGVLGKIAFEISAFEKDADATIINNK